MCKPPLFCNRSKTYYRRQSANSQKPSAIAQNPRDSYSCRIAYALSRSQLCPCPVPSSVCSLLGCQGSLPLRLSYSLAPSLSDRRMPSRFSSSSPAALPSDSLARFGGACSSALHVPSLAASHSLRLFLSLSLLSSRSVVCAFRHSVGVSPADGCIIRRGIPVFKVDLSRFSIKIIRIDRFSIFIKYSFKSHFSFWYQ